MLDVLGGDPYYVFGQPLILKVMPEYFDFSSSDMMEMPSWIRFFNLPLKCWSSTCLTKLSNMLGKPIHCDTPTASMTRLSYARVLIEVDMLIDLPSSIHLVLPNGSTLTQQVMFESLPRLCKTCRIIGHTVSTCNKGTKTYISWRKHTKLAKTGHSSDKRPVSPTVIHVSHNYNVIAVVKPPKRQYLTRSRAATTPNFGQQGKHRNSSVADSSHQSSSKDSKASSSH
ncbi:hypothetical protein Peur_039378 [Populus x canadensis]